MVALVAAAAIALTGCTSTTTSSGGRQRRSTKEDLVLVASVINTTNPYMASMIEGAKALSAKLGVPLEIVDSQGSSQTEISKIQAILAQGKKVALMVNTVASSDAPTDRQRREGRRRLRGRSGGTSPTTWSRGTSGNNFVAFQKHSGVESGECTGKALAESLGGKGNIIALAGVQDSTTSQTRVAGLQEALKAYPDIKLLETRYGQLGPAEGVTETQNMLTKYPNQVNGFWAADDAMIIGATQAVQSAGLENSTKFVSDGLYPPVIDMMKSNFGNGRHRRRDLPPRLHGRRDRPVHRLPGRDRRDRPVDAAAGEAGQPVQVELRHADRPRPSTPSTTRTSTAGSTR